MRYAFTTSGKSKAQRPGPAGCILRDAETNAVMYSTRLVQFGVSAVSKVRGIELQIRDPAGGDGRRDLSFDLKLHR
jgi:hypothetical protein